MLKSYNFWIRLVAVLVLLLRIVGSEFGFSVDSGLIIDLATALASVLVVLGVIQVPVQKIDTSVLVDDKNKTNISGGEFMKTFEQIKEDLLKVKEKIESSVNKENTIAGEIGAIIDGIIAEEESSHVDVVIDEVGGATDGQIEDGIDKEDGLDADIIDGEQERTQASEVVESSEVETVVVTEGLIADEKQTAEDDFTEKLVEDAISTVNEFITEEEKSKVDIDKLNDVVREKIASLLVGEIDNILRDASI